LLIYFFYYIILLMSVNPNGEPSMAEVAPGTVQTLWSEANTLVRRSPNLPLIGRVDNFEAQLDGMLVNLVVMAHETQPAEEGIIGSITVRPEGGNDEKDATFYQFRPAPEGVSVRKLLPVDLSRAGFKEPMPLDAAEHRAWVERREAAEQAYEMTQRAEHDLFGLGTIYDDEAQGLIGALKIRRATLESQQASLGFSKAGWLGALTRRFLHRG
jgi:hypothetical protein